MQPRALAFAVLALALVPSTTGCGWWRERKAKADLAKVHDDAQKALEAMREVDQKVIEARASLKSSSSLGPSALAAVIHDYAEALRGGVEPAQQLAKAVAPMDGTSATKILAEHIQEDATAVDKKCGHKLKLDEIDKCGGAWGQLINSANVLAEFSTMNGQELTRPRKNGE
jgi:hypothetical protein